MVDKEGTVTVVIEQEASQEEAMQIVHAALNELGVKLEKLGQHDDGHIWRLSRMEKL